MKVEPKRINNRRVGAAPIGGFLATLGFYATDIQKVVERWKGKVPVEIIEDTFTQCAMAFHSKELRVQARTPLHWPMIADLFSATTRIYTDRTKVEYWLLTLPDVSCASTSHHSPETPAWKTWGSWLSKWKRTERCANGQ